MSSEPSSLDKAFHKVAESAPVLGVDMQPQQLDLLRDKRGRLPDNVFQLARAMPEERRGPGRRPGSLNKRSENLAKLVIHKFGDPVEAMASLYAMPLDQLVELLKIADRGSKDAKPGDLAVKALNVQLAAMKSVSEYVHSKKPTEVVAKVSHDAVLVLPAAQGSAEFSAVDETTRLAGEGIAKLLAKGSLTAEDIAGLRLVDGQLVHDAEFEEVDADDEGDEFGPEAAA